MTALALQERAPDATLESRVADLNADEASADAQAILTRAMLDEFPGRIALVSSFGAESAPLLHLAAAIDRSVPVFFLDTGKHFAQTLDYRRTLAQRLGMTDVRDLAPDAASIAAHDPRGDLWRRDNDRCCAIRKVAPLASALGAFDAWITGRKRFHGGLRGRLAPFEAAAPHVKVNPLVAWNADELVAYAVANSLPPHPLVEQGFRSIGCWPCTEPAAPDDDSRAGRWRGASKTECGIHRIGATGRD